MPVTGWKWEPNVRALLLEGFPAVRPDVIVGHVTPNAGVRAALAETVHG